MKDTGDPDTGTGAAAAGGRQRLLWLLVGLLFVAQVAALCYVTAALKAFEVDQRQLVASAAVVQPCTCRQSEPPTPTIDIDVEADTDPDADIIFRSRRSTERQKRNNGTVRHKKGKGQRRPRSDKHGSTTTTMTPLVESAAAPATTSPAAHVEFVNPRFKEEFLSTDNGVGNGVADAETTHAKDNPWVWLNAYSRIPVNAIQDFCSATKDYCPPGPPGPLGPIGMVGDRGPRGDKGERGFPGELGIRGPTGPMGPPGARGPKGDMGKTGLPGLNGRDGVPGEPGLDGVPGRSGKDGVPGMDGLSGTDGLAGKPGRDGIDGQPGLTGLPGLTGPAGPQGLTGPRGKAGRPGLNGVPGIPGVNTWVVNSTDPRRIVLIPPSIIGADRNGTVRTVVLKEGELLRLRCGTSGFPRPDVAWMRSDGALIPIGAWKTSDVLGPVFNITKVHREHMGAYRCVADNGIPPPAQATFNVEVHFAPQIRVTKPSVGVANGSWALLECHIEAFPEPLCYWERFDGRGIETVHRTALSDRGKYRVHLSLNLTIVHPNDYGRYQCVSKNEEGTTRGTVSVFEVDPHFATPPPTSIGAGAGGSGTDVLVWGPSPPDLVDLDDMCPPPPDCPRCPPPATEKCRDAGLGQFDILGRMEIRPLGNETYPGFVNRTQDCVLSAIGKPVYHRYTEAPYGNWMRDALPRTPADADKYWATKYGNSYHLFEYATKAAFKRDTPTRNYTLPFALKGHLHVVYNGSLYYHQQEEPRVIRYELASERNTMATLPNATCTGNIFVYTQSQSYLDFAVDETGLWVIYGLQPNNNTAVAKLNAYSLDVEYVWNISLNNQRAGEMFVVCGVLYAVDSVTERNTKIRFALDLFRNKLLDVELPFTNPFRKTTMVGYNARTKELYTWDKGNQLTYPVKSVDIGYNTPESNDLTNGPDAFTQDDPDLE